MKRRSVVMVIALGLAVTGLVTPAGTAVRANYCNPATGCQVTVPMTVSPNPVVTSRDIFVQIQTGSYCTYLHNPFTVYATRDHPMLSVTLGYAGVMTYSGVVFLHAVAPPPGVWRIDAFTKFCASNQTDSWVVTATEVVETVKPAPAAPAPPKQTPPQVKPASPPRPVVIPTVHIQTFKFAPVLADFHTVAALRQPSPPSVPGGGALPALVAAAVAALTFAALWRRRSRQHR